MTPAAPRIRTLAAADAEAFSALRREVRAAHPVQMGTAAAERRVRRIRRRQSGGDRGGGRFSPFAAAAHKMTMWAVFTSPRYRRQGLSRQVVGHAIAHAFGNGIRRVNLTVYVPNEPALRLYRSLGFLECGREPEAVQIAGRYHHGVQLTLRRADADAASYEYP